MNLYCKSKKNNYFYNVNNLDIFLGPSSSNSDECKSPWRISRLESCSRLSYEKVGKTTNNCSKTSLAPHSLCVHANYSMLTNLSLYNYLLLFLRESLFVSMHSWMSYVHLKLRSILNERFLSQSPSWFQVEKYRWLTLGVPCLSTSEKPLVTDFTIDNLFITISLCSCKKACLRPFKPAVKFSANQKTSFFPPPPQVQVRNCWWYGSNSRKG